VTSPAHTGLDGVRLLSHRPTVLFKIAHLGLEPEDGDVADGGVVMSGPGWGDRLREALEALSHAERACLFAVRLDDGHGLPLPAKTLLDRARTDWFPKFLSQGRFDPVFQPIVDLADGSVYGREALMRGRMGKSEVRGAELLEAALAHDALFSFDTRARVAALEAGLPILPAGEILYVNLDLRAVLDVDSSLRGVWPVAERLGGGAGRIGLELMDPEHHPDPSLLASLVAAHRKQGALIALDDLSAGDESLQVLEQLKPDLAKLSQGLVRNLETSAARRRLVGALVEVAHEIGTKVVAVGIERDSELESVAALGVDYGQGFFLGRPTEEMLPVDVRMVRRGASAATAA
jgi:EAL domain-containing protein (putative c-di-GMP-specific phosphodiesterase class I)